MSKKLTPEEEKAIEEEFERTWRETGEAIANSAPPKPLNLTPEERAFMERVCEVYD